MNSSTSLLWARSADIVVNVVSGLIIVALAYFAWLLREEASIRNARKRRLKDRASRLKLLEAELETIVSFTAECEMAASALDQFTTYQQWLVANGLLSWKQNRLVVQTWQQTTGAAVAIRSGQIAIAPDVIEQLVADMRKTELPRPEDDDFRWSASNQAPPPEEQDPAIGL